jgi:streptomycin 6-kinase
VRQRARLDPVEAELGESKLCHLRHRGACVPTTIHARADPVAEVAGLKREAMDVAQRHPSDNPVIVVEDHVRDHQPTAVVVEELGDRRALPGKREELRSLDRLPRRQELAVDVQQIRKRLGVLERQRPDSGHIQIMIAGESRQPRHTPVVTSIRVPALLAAAVGEDRHHQARARWLAALPEIAGSIAAEWELELGEPYEPGGQCAWIAPARHPEHERVVLKVEWRHPEAEHEADALRLWDGDGAICCLATRVLEDTIVLLLERCEPGRQLRLSRAEPEQDLVIASLLRRLWKHQPPEHHPFDPLQAMCGAWADSFERDYGTDAQGLDLGLARDAVTLLRELPGTAEQSVLLSTDLHAENVLSAYREPWLAIDPKPYVGDPAYDTVQHMLNCERLATDPIGLSRRMAELLDLDAERVRLWLFARCAQESLHDGSMRKPARMLAL